MLHVVMPTGTPGLQVPISREMKRTQHTGKEESKWPSSKVRARSDSQIKAERRPMQSEQSAQRLQESLRVYAVCD